jgi:hypothetical protein
MYVRPKGKRYKPIKFVNAGTLIEHQFSRRQMDTACCPTSNEEQPMYYYGR